MAQHNCRKMLGDLSEFVDGELSEEMCAEIERHLATCENCRVVVDTLKKTVSLVQSEPAEPDLPQGVRERLYHCLNLDDFLVSRPSKGQ